jgi:hypothetical protein
MSDHPSPHRPGSSPAHPVSSPLPVPRCARVGLGRAERRRGYRPVGTRQSGGDGESVLLVPCVVLAVKTRGSAAPDRPRQIDLGDGRSPGYPSRRAARNERASETLPDKRSHGMPAWVVINPSTNYQSGVDWRLDWGASQFVSKQVFFGAVGYFYEQISPDSGSGDHVGPFESGVIGVGPQMGVIHVHLCQIRQASSSFPMSLFRGGCRTGHSRWDCWSWSCSDIVLLWPETEIA